MCLGKHNTKQCGSFREGENKQTNKQTTKKKKERRFRIKNATRDKEVHFRPRT